MRVAVALALATVALIAAPASQAGAADPEPIGSATLTVKQGKWKALGKRGISLAGVGGADSTGRRVRLSGSGGAIGEAAASLRYRGALKLVAGEGKQRRTVRLGGLTVQLGPAPSVSGRLAGKSRVLFGVNGGSMAVEGAKGAASLQGAKLSWRPSVRALLNRRLGAQLPPGVFATLRVSAATVFTETPKSGPITPASDQLQRPASAVDVKAATLSWHVRDSWIRYLNTEQAPQAFDGTSAQAPIEESKHPCPNSPAGANPTLVYSYDFPFANGWYDAASGTAALYYNGGLRFSYPSHGIDLTARSPEIEINGAASRAVFRMQGGGSTPYPDQRASLLSLAAGSPSATGPGAYGFPEPLRGTLTADGQAVFAGFYPPPNDGFGCFSVSFSTG